MSKKRKSTPKVGKKKDTKHEPIKYYAAPEDEDREERLRRLIADHSNLRGSNWRRNKSRRYNDEDRECFLRILESHEVRGFVSYGCQIFGISPMTYYKWRDKYPDFAAATDEIRDAAKLSNLDLAENSLLRCMRDLNVTAIKYYLSHQGKERGYGNYQEDKDTEAHDELSKHTRELLKTWQAAGVSKIEE